METKARSEEYVAPSDGTLALQSSEPETRSITAPANGIYSTWQQIGGTTAAFLAQLPAYIGRFFAEYKQAIISVALILAAIVALRLVLAVMDALNAIPLFSTIFELIGISYATWFIFRYLLKAENRQELATQIQALRQQIVGEDPSETLS